MKTPTSAEARRIRKKNLNEVIAGSIQDKLALEQRALNSESASREKPTMQRIGKNARERYRPHCQ